MTIKTYKRVFIDFDDLQNWLREFLKASLPSKQIYIIEQEYHLSKGSKLFADIDICEPLTKEELLKKEAVVHSRGGYIHFYVDDVVTAAHTAGMLEGNSFCVYDS